MMKLDILETQETPRMILDHQLGHLSIEGKSYSENVNDSFREFFDHLDQYCLNAKKETLVEFKWLYYNTATTRIILNILRKVQEVSLIRLKWYCKKESFMMIQKGQELAEILDLEIEVVYY